MASLGCVLPLYASSVSNVFPSVVYRPGPPTNVALRALSTGSFELTWDPPISGDPPTLYRVVVKGPSICTMNPFFSANDHFLR